MAAFATVDELATYLGVDSLENEDQAELMLQLASAAIADAAGQTLELVEDDEIIIRGGWGRELWLPQRPVVEVTSIEIDGNDLAVDSFTVTSDGRVTFYNSAWEALDRSSPSYGSRFWGGDEVLVRVVYTHGFATIPDNIKGLCLELGKRSIQTPDAGAIRSESVGTYSVSYSSEAAQTLTRGERRRLRRYRRKNHNVVTSPA